MLLTAGRHYCWLLCLLAVIVVRGNVIYVDPTSPTCNDELGGLESKLSSSLQNLLPNITSNTVLMLKPGCHSMNKYVPILDKINVTIQGQGTSPVNVTIDCGQHDVGVTFLNTSGLTLRKLSIHNCGLSGSNLNDSINCIKNRYLDSFESIFSYPSAIRIGLFIANSYNVTIDNVRVEKVHGFGFLAVNIMNSFIIQSSRFAHNYNASCFSSLNYGLSGGVIIISQDTNEISSNTNFHIAETEFLYNSNCALDNQEMAFSADFNQLTYNNKPYLIGGGGGLTVYLANHNYSLSVDIINCTFQNNSGVSGGGMLIGTFVGIDDNKVNIDNCIFRKNGFEFGGLSDQNRRLIGQGIYIRKDIRFPVNSIRISVGNNNFSIVDCIFEGNIATSVAGLLIVSRYLTIGEYFNSDIISIENCTFSKNKAFSTSAIYITESKQNYAQPGIRIYISDTTIVHNEIQTTRFTLSPETVSSLNTFEANTVIIVMNGTNKFIANRGGTPFNIHFGSLTIHGTVIFANNSGDTGGGLSLTTSVVTIKPNSRLSFVTNEAYLKAGAIYFTSSGEVASFDCFLYFNNSDLVQCDDSHPCVDPSSANITVSFNHNIAPMSNVAFGSTLQRCPWVKFLQDKHNLSNLTNPYQMLQVIGVFEFTPPLNDNDLSTTTARLTTEVTNQSVIMPGQQIIVNVKAYDGFNQVIPDPISSAILDDVVLGDQDSRLGNSSYWFLSRNNFQDVPVSIRSMRQIEQNESVNVTVAIYSIVSIAGSEFNLTITQCYKGFEFPSNNASMYKTCVCNTELQRYPAVTCSEENATIVVPTDYWLGETEIGNNKWTLSKCVFDYCHVGIGVIQNGDFDQQCNYDYHRSGILCGDCAEGYSQIIGSNKCEKCSNLYLLLSLYFVVGGILIFGTIGKLSVTVSYGYINSLLFFANVITPLKSSLLMESSFNDFLFPIEVLNGGFGFRICFFDGMTAIHRAYLQFLFPAYLYLLLLLYTLLGRYCNYHIFKKWTSNASQVFATVILMTYTSLLSSCMANLSFVILSDDSSLRWTVNPNEKFFSKADHIILVLISIVVLVFYLIPSTVMLLFPSLTLRTPIGKKFIPIYDAFWAPFRERRQFWVGFRLILRIIPLVFAGYVPHPLNVVLLAIFVVIYTFIHIVFKPFYRDVQNTLDYYLNLCLILIIVGALYRFDNIDNNVSASQAKTFQDAYFAIMMLFVYGAIAFVYMHHLYMKYTCLQHAVERLKQLVKRKRVKKIMHNETSSLNKDSYDDDDDDGNLFNGRVNNTGNSYKYYSVNNVTVLREPLLEDSYYNDEL